MASELGLLSEPVVEHLAREADMPPHPMARQATSPHRLIDPACLDVEIPSGLLRAKESILRQRGARITSSAQKMTNSRAQTPSLARPEHADPAGRRPAILCGFAPPSRQHAGSPALPTAIRPTAASVADAD